MNDVLALQAMATEDEAALWPTTIHDTTIKTILPWSTMSNGCSSVSWWCAS